MPARKQNSNKGTFGKVLNFSGSKNYIGASYLSTVSVLRTGAGYVALSADKNIISAVSNLLPEAVYLSRKDGIKNIDLFNTILIGCGLGQNYQSKRLFKSVLQKTTKTDKCLIIDADGLNILAKIEIKLPPNTIITPHPAEAARLLGCTIKEVLSDIESSARKLVQKYNCIVVLKSHNTIICNQNLDIYINKHGNSALAKAGTGDVLAGIISGLAAQGMPAYEASVLGVYLHSRTGEILSEKYTEYSILASDIPNNLYLAIKELD
ncbi:MAG: NAD(P)H-hydrate dehydratase [bacterium]|nr:NAD(P)H-hydrate dehydratase [bacterium]